MLIDIGAESSATFKHGILSSGATATFGDGAAEGDLLVVTQEETAASPFTVQLTFGTTSGGADDAATPVDSADASTQGVGVPMICGRDMPHTVVFRLSHPVKYVKALNSHNTEALKNLQVCFCTAAKRV